MGKPPIRSTACSSISGTKATGSALTSEKSDGDGPASNAAQQMLADAMAQSFGLVEKIDFDNLKFETDDE